MSRQLINRSPDLKKLQDEGYNIEEIAGYLVLWDVPFVNTRREVVRGALVSRLDLAGERTAKPTDHVVLFAGDHPCNLDGTEITQIKHGSSIQQISDRLTVHHSFSNKPTGGYDNYHHKMIRYVEIISNPAKAIDPDIKAQTYPVIRTEEDDDSPFHYSDTASSRADIVEVTRKLKLSKVAIVGLGGTGSYVLDLVAKTPIREIHLFDGDVFLQHNAFRAPGAPSIEELEVMPKKVKYHAERYSKMHKGIIQHDHSLEGRKLSKLDGMDFVFLCIDGGESKRHIVEKLEKADIPFIDTGIGVNLVDGALHGAVRLTSSTTHKRDHLRSRVGFTEDENNEYSRNIQIADLNALNAALAVIRWKKLFGFYKDFENEHHCHYDIDGNFIHNDDKP